MTEPRVGVALSGGGHRASLWSWGALFALADADVNRHVVSVASVSGGSIANGALANAGDYTSMKPDDLVRASRPAIRVASRDGLFFFGPPTDPYVTRFVAVVSLFAGALVAALSAGVAAGRGWPPLPWLAAGPLLAGATWLFLLRPKHGTALLPARMRNVALVALVAAGPLTAAAVAVTTAADGWAAIAAAAAVTVAAAAVGWATLRLFARRSVEVDAALGRTLLATDGTPTLLASVDRTAHHVFCVTELQSGDHVYVTPRLVYGYRVGRGTAGPLTVATAVQCSACLPGAFAARTLRCGPLALTRPWPVSDNEPPAPPETLVVNDGGVYDNMADQWEQGHRRRQARLPDLDDLQPPADMLVVVNASKALAWNRMPPANTVAHEVRGLAASVDVLYDVSTSHRRNAMVSRFTADPDLDGVLVHIGQSPFRVPEAFTGSPDPQQRTRATAALQFLRTLGMDDDAWRQQAARNSQVPTTLSAVGADVAADLLHHSYVLTRINVWVVLGVGTPLTDPAQFARSRFEALA